MSLTTEPVRALPDETGPAAAEPSAAAGQPSEPTGGQPHEPTNGSTHASGPETPGAPQPTLAAASPPSAAPSSVSSPALSSVSSPAVGAAATPPTARSAEPSGVLGIRLESGAPAGPAAAPAQPAAAPAPQPAAPRTAAATAPAVCVQPVPTATACAIPPQRGIAQERDWVRRTFGARYHATAGTVSRVLSQAPALRGGSRAGQTEALTDLVAVSLYLAGDSGAVDEAVRAATVGPHVPLARCVAAGLRRLPSYRGAALLRSRVSQAERAWYRTGRLTTEWAFCTAQAAAHSSSEAGTDFLIWSLTARRTSLLDPAAPDRVVFAPGTAFKVLRAASDEDAPVLLRELLAGEIARDGRVEPPQLPLDEIALHGLDQAAQLLAWAHQTAAAVPSTAEVPGISLGAPPGLITVASRSLARTAGSPPVTPRTATAPAEGATS